MEGRRRGEGEAKEEMEKVKRKVGKAKEGRNKEKMRQREV